MTKSIGRRNFALNGGVLLAGLSLGTRVVAAPASNTDRAAITAGEVSWTNAAIHQEVTFGASPAAIYQALTVTEKFDNVVQLSAAMNTSMKKMLGRAPTQIDPVPGGAFSLFGGYVTGHMLELVADSRIVQAWRAGSWPEGAYSIARFVLLSEDSQTRLSFDHTGFPNEAAVHLAEGWHINYWEPLTKFLT